MNKKINWLLPGIAGGLVLLSLLFYISRQWGHFKLSQGITDLKKVSFLLHAVGDNGEYFFSSWIHLYPQENKIGMYFVNPLSRFPGEEEPIYKLKSGAIKTVEKELTSIIGTSPHYTITIQSNVFVRIINLAGGLPVFLEPKSFIDSPRYKRPINSSYRMEGEDALDYLLSVNPEDALSYVHRLERQESALLAFFFLVKSKQNLMKKPWIQLLQSWLDSNLAPDEWNSLVDFLLAEDVQFGVSELPGEIQGGAKKGEFVLQINTDTSRIAFKKFEADLLSEFFTDPERARVEVLNGTKVNGLARKGKSLLSEKRIKVLTVENAWQDDFPKTYVLNRSGNSKISGKIQDALQEEEVYFSIRKELGLDATVVLGDDFAKTN